MTVAEPEVGWEPDQASLAVHDVALVLDHVSVALSPGVTAAGAMERVVVTAGGGGVEWIEEEPLLQPERTRAQKRTIKVPDRSFLFRAGAYIRPPFR
jgi:hypothetical protein